MTEQYKQAIVDSIKAQRKLDNDSAFAKELDSIVKESVSDALFIAKVNTALSIYDQGLNQKSETGLGINAVSKNVMTNALNDAIAGVELEGEPAGYSPGQYTSWLVNTPFDIRADILEGLDISAGVIAAEGDEAQSYFDYLVDKLDDWYDATGQIGAIVKPGGGKGAVMFSSPEYDRYKKNYDAPSASLQQFRETDPGRTKVPKKGFRAEPTVLYEPIMSGEPGKYEFSGEYINNVKQIDDTYKTVKEAGGQITVINNATGETEFLTVSDSELVELQNQQLESGTTIIQSQDAAIVEQAKSAILGQSQDIAAYGLFGGITPGYTIYKNPDLASVFEEGKELDTSDLAAETITLTAEDVANRYGGQDHIRIGYNMLPQERLQVQTDLLQAGYLSYDDWFFEQGSWGGASQAAMLEAMTYANYELTDIGTHLADEKARLYKRPPLLPKVFVEPSPSQIKAEVDGALRAIGIDRELSEAEMVAFADFYTEASKNYETAVANFNKNYDLAQRMFPGADKNLTVPETPDAQLQEYADAVLGAEVQATEQATKERNDLSYLFSTLDSMSRLASG